MNSARNINKSTINLYGTTIIVSGNKQDDYQQIEKLFKKIDANIIWIQNNIELTGYINKTKFLNLRHIILMDISEHTEETIRKCKEIKLNYKNIPVIAMVDCVQQEGNLNILKVNFDDLVLKPLNFSEMWRVISKVITRSV